MRRMVVMVEMVGHGGEVVMELVLKMGEVEEMKIMVGGVELEEVMGVVEREVVA